METWKEQRRKILASCSSVIAEDIKPFQEPLRPDCSCWLWIAFESNGWLYYSQYLQDLDLIQLIDNTSASSLSLTACFSRKLHFILACYPQVPQIQIYSTTLMSVWWWHWYQVNHRRGGAGGLWKGAPVTRKYIAMTSRWRLYCLFLRLFIIDTWTSPCPAKPFCCKWHYYLPGNPSTGRSSHSSGLETNLYSCL